jgi:CBS domain-containing protein
MRQDKLRQSSNSQSVSSNVSSSNALVRDVLASKSGDVISIQPRETLGRAVELLRDHRIGALVVVDANGALSGILSERDIVRKLADTPGRTLPQTVDAVMTRDVQTCETEDALVSLLKRMTAGRFRHMPVVEGGKVLGMVTIGDVVNYRLTELEHEALQLKQLIVG